MHEQREKDAAHRSKWPELKQKITFPTLGKLQEDCDLCTDSLTCKSKGRKVIHRQDWQTRLLEKLHVGESDVMSHPLPQMPVLLVRELGCC